MISLNGHTIYFKKFPNGESFADIDLDMSPKKGDVNEIFFKFEDDTDIFQLLCVKQYVDETWPTLPCTLIMPYIPYSRMDRQEETRLFTLKYFAKVINSMNFTFVEVMEPHSEVSPALFDRVKVINKSAELALQAMADALGLVGSCWVTPSYEYTDGSRSYDYCLEGMLYQARQKGVYLVYPDAGAEKRYRKQITYDKVLTCSKDRDFNTGRIKSIVINGADKAQDCEIAVIIDDLSSKGGTFSGCAAELRKVLPKLKQVILCVTHCENTIYQGTVLSGADIDKVYTTNSILVEPGSKDIVNFDKSKLVVERI